MNNKLVKSKLSSLLGSSNNNINNNNNNNSPICTSNNRNHKQTSNLQRINDNTQNLEQTSEDQETYESSSADDDLEDHHSPDISRQRDKPKPGKLDLSQFDNITNAIGKLTVQQSVGLKQASSCALLSHRQATENSPLGSLFNSQSSQQQHHSAPKNTQSSSFFKSKSKSRQTAGSNAFKKSQHEDQLETVDAPQPAPRSIAQQQVSDNIKTVSSFSSAAPGFVSSASGNLKRALGPGNRQNHGRAVAPPKLPSADQFNLMIQETTSDQPPKTSAFNSNLTATTSFAPSTQDDEHNAIDFSQSPIAQRLLKHYKDFKVSELNSPYQSDSEQIPSSNSISSYKVPKFSTRGENQGFRVKSKSPATLLVNSSIDSSELINSRGAAIRQLNEILANKQPPGRLAGPKQSSHLISQNQALEREYHHLPSGDTSRQSNKSRDKDVKRDKKKLRDDEKRRLKEEERVRRLEKKTASKKSKASTANQEGAVGDDGIPLFIKRCIEFIELEGLDAEGLYRVPGNRAHVDAFVQKFKENCDMSIVESDIPVNAVATALKDFLSKKWGPIIPIALMSELTDLSTISEKEQRVQAVRELVKKLPPPNYKLLKYVFYHFVKVSLNHSLNSMDSKNLAICWWPTLLPLHFNDMVMFEQMRPHLEESIQTMIDQYDFIFDSEMPNE